MAEAGRPLWTFRPRQDGPSRAHPSRAQEPDMIHSMPGIAFRCVVALALVLYLGGPARAADSNHGTPTAQKQGDPLQEAFPYLLGCGIVALVLAAGWFFAGGTLPQKDRLPAPGTSPPEWDLPSSYAAPNPLKRLIVPGIFGAVFVAIAIPGIPALFRAYKTLHSPEAPANYPSFYVPPPDWQRFQYPTPPQINFTPPPPQINVPHVPVQVPTIPSVPSAPGFRR
jgi:hypothetical protein